MPTYNYNRYKIRIAPDSEKRQGLAQGDIVRRQYTGKSRTVYSLMAVLETGEERIEMPAGISLSPYFVGALLEGDEPRDGELLDFVRVSNLFDENRSGALYLTSSDSEAPYMDVIDEVGTASSLCRPSAGGGSEDTVEPDRYCCTTAYFASQYKSEEDGIKRILRMTRNTATEELDTKVGLVQNLKTKVGHPQRVVISYRVRASKPLTGIPLILECTGGERIDGHDTVDISNQWQYKLNVITTDYPAFSRTVRLDLAGVLGTGDWVEIAELNICLLSDIASFSKAMRVRVGNISGVVDPLFGMLYGYGAYFQNLYATKNVSVAGTLTAGDQDGFASTFYVGRIHRNCFLNSLQPKFTTLVTPETVKPPTGIGKVYLLPIGSTTLECQSEDWAQTHHGEQYCFSFWAYASSPHTVTLKHGGEVVGALNIGTEWKRHHFSLRITHVTGEPMRIELSGFDPFIFASPQLETGSKPTFYQPTDDVLTETDEYGAWFSRGGIGGTIQHPLLKLEADGTIRSANDSFVINADGTGYFAGGKFKWDTEHIVLEDLNIDWEKVAEHMPKPVAVRAEIASNQPLTQVYYWETNKTVPNWAVNPHLKLTPSLFVSTFGQTDQITALAAEGVPGIKPGSVTWYKDNQAVVSGKDQTMVADVGGRYAMTVLSNCIGTWAPQMTFAFTAIYVDKNGVETSVRAEKQFTLLSAPGATIIAVMQTPDGVVFRSGEPSTLRLHCDMWRGAELNKTSMSYAWGVPDETVYANTQVAQAVAAGATRVQVRSTTNMVAGTQIQFITTEYTITEVDHTSRTVSFTPALSMNLAVDAIVICPRYNALLGGGWITLDESNPCGTLSGWNGPELVLTPDAVAGSQTFKCAIRDDYMNKDNPSAGKIVYATVSVSDLSVPDITALDWIEDWDSSKTHIGAEVVVTPKIFAGVKHDDGLLTGVAIGHFPLTMYTDTSTGLGVRDIDGIVGFDHGRKVFSVESSGNVQMGFGNQSIRYNASTGQIEFGTGVSARWIGATYIDANGIFTGTLSAQTVNAVTINASQITAGIIDTARINVESLKTSILTAANIEALALHVKKGTIGGWTIDAESIYRGVKSNTGFSYTSSMGSMTIGSAGIRGNKWRLEAQGAGALAGGNIMWDTAGNVTFSESVSVKWQSGIDVASELARAMAFGKMLYRDPTFSQGVNGIRVYNNLDNGNVILVRVADPDAPNDTHQVLEITTTGTVSPGYGGFSFATTSAANKIFITRIIAKIPVGYNIVWNSNATGTGRINKCLTSTQGTGKWEEYVFMVRCGSEGTFSTTNYFYLESAPNEALPITWKVAYATVFDATSAEKYTTTINSNGIYTGSLTAGQITAGTLSADRIATGSLKAEKLDAASVKASIINTDYINGLSLTFSQGRIGGWNIGATTISAGQITLDTANRRIAVFRSGANQVSGQRVQMYYNSDTDFGIFVADAVGVGVVTLGGTNRIAGWNLTNSTISKGNVSLGADGSIINGTRWKLNNDGSGQLASGNISWSAAGSVTFAPSVSLSWESGISVAKELAHAMTFGRMIYRVPEFYANGSINYNGTNPYCANIVRSIEAVAGCPNLTRYALKCVATAWHSPTDRRVGGFMFGTQSRANAIFIVRIIAMIPVGLKIENFHNQYGTGGVSKWLTPTVGTGKWEEYICKVTCGSSGSFSALNHFALMGGVTPTAAAPVIWYIAYATVFDVTSSEKYTTTLDANGIYTGTLTAAQVNAVAINASSITAGTLSADRLAAGSIKAEKLDAASIKASLINTDYINGLSCSFTKGKIGGWVIGADNITAGILGSVGGTPMQIRTAASGSGYWYNGSYRPYGITMTWHQLGNAGHIVLGQIAASGSTVKSGFVGLQMLSWDNAEYFCLSTNTQLSGSKEVYNRIAGWAFDNSRIWKNSVSLGADGSIQNTTKWQLNNDGSGRVASGNIAWDAAGNVTFGASVALNWTNASAQGRIYVRGTGLNRNAPPLVYVNGTQIITGYNRGLGLTVLNRSDLSVVSSTYYDVYGSLETCNTLAAAMNAIGSDKIVILTSYDAITINDTLRIAIERCGGSDWSGSGRYPYALIGIPGIGKNNGLLAIWDVQTTEPYAELSTTVINGNPQGISSFGRKLTSITEHGIYTGAISAGQVRVDTALIVGGSSYNGSISVRDASNNVKVTLDRTGIRAVAGTIGGWNLSSSQIYSGSVVLSSGGSITNGTRWRLNADGSGQMANGNFSWDASGKLTATGGNFKDVTIQGTIRSAFVKNDPSIWIGGSDSAQTDPRHYDNVVVMQTGSWLQNINLPWTLDQSGRRLCLVNYKWGTTISTGRMEISAPSGKYFYEDGIAKTTLTFSREVIELLGYGDNVTFFGFIVINRRDIMCESRYGLYQQVLAQGTVSCNSTTNASIKCKTFDGTTMSAIKSGTGNFYVYLPWTLGADKYMVMLTGVTSPVQNGPIYATVRNQYASYFQISTQDDNNANEGSFNFQIISTADFQ